MIMKLLWVKEIYFVGIFHFSFFAASSCDRTEHNLQWSQGLHLVLFHLIWSIILIDNLSKCPTSIMIMTLSKNRVYISTQSVNVVVDHSHATILYFWSFVTNYFSKRNNLWDCFVRLIYHRIMLLGQKVISQDPLVDHILEIRHFEMM